MSKPQKPHVPPFSHLYPFTNPFFPLHTSHQHIITSLQDLVESHSPSTRRHQPPRRDFFLPAEAQGYLPPLSQQEDTRHKMSISSPAPKPLPPLVTSDPRLFYTINVSGENFLVSHSALQYDSPNFFTDGNHSSLLYAYIIIIWSHHTFALSSLFP